MDIISAEDIAFLSNQSTSRMNMVISGMTTLMNDIDGKVEMMESQNWFQRMINTVTGKNRVTRDEIKRNHDKLNAYMSEAISELYNQNCIDHQIMISLGNQINELYAEHLQLKRMLGEFAKKLNEKIESVDNFHMLMEEINQGMYENEKNKSIYSLVSVLAMMDKRILMDKRKCDIITHALRKQYILNSDIMTLEECLLQALDLNADEFGKFYMEVNSIHDHYFASMLVEAMQSKYFLPENQWNNVDKKEIVNRIIVREDFDPMSQVTTEDIFDDFFLAKQDLANGLLPFSAIQLDDKLKEAEELFINCKLEKAVPILHTLAEKGYGRAMYLLGIYYDNRDLTGSFSADEEEAEIWYSKGNEAGDVLAKVHIDEDISMEVFNKVYRLAQNGNIFAQYELADLYYYGDGCEESEEQYFYFLERTAELGYWLSLVKLGDYYNYFDDVENEKCLQREQSLIWYEKAAEKGNTYAMNELADMYWYGNVVDENDLKAFEWYKRSAELGNIDAQYALARCYEGGFGVEKDLYIAFYWCKKSAEGGLPEGQRALAVCYRVGDGCDIDMSKAKEWSLKAAEQGDEEAIKNLKEWFGIVF